MESGLGVQEQAKRLAVEVHDRDSVDLRLRVGLNSGQVIAGDIGSSTFRVTPPLASRSAWPNEWSLLRRPAG